MNPGEKKMSSCSNYALQHSQKWFLASQDPYYYCPSANTNKAVYNVKYQLHFEIVTKDKTGKQKQQQPIS